MAKQIINIGASANDGTGDPLRNAFDKTNDNFNELYLALGGASSATNLFDTNGAFDLSGKPHKITFYYDTEAALLQVNPATYHGAIGHAHDTGALYYAHGSWRKLLSDTSGGSITNYTDPLNAFVYSANITNSEQAGYVLGTSANGSYSWIAGGGSSFTTTDVDNHLNSGSAQTNEVLSWDGSDYAWVSAGGGSGYTDSDVNAHLNTGTASANEVLSWNGSDYDWVAQSGGGSSTLAALTEVNTADLDVHDMAYPATTVHVLTPNGSTAYRSDHYGTTDNPTLYVNAGETIAFDLTSVTASHPFEIRSDASTAYNTGLVHIAPDGTKTTGSAAQGKTSGVLYWKVPGSISGTYKYICTAHSSMIGDIVIADPSAGGGGGGLQTRTTKSIATSSISDGVKVDTAIDGFASFGLMKIETSHAAWVRLYVDTASRTADASRLETTDPSPDAGVIAEVITTGAETIKFGPGVLGWLDSGTSIPVSITNKSGGQAAITVTLTVLELEA